MSFFKYKGLYLTIAIASFILFLSLQPMKEENTELLVSDKLLHIIAYGVMVLPVLLERVFPQLLICIIALGYGGLIELIQPFWGREADTMDFIANAVGIILGFIISQGYSLFFNVQT